MAKEISIGDEVWVHGYVDEIRKDVIIIRNDGGYFGTVKGEIVIADYKVDLGNGFSITANTAVTPQTDTNKVVCPNCGKSDYIRSFEKDFHIKSEFKYKCINCNTYIKDEPQTDCPKRGPTMEEISDNCVGLCDIRDKVANCEVEQGDLLIDAKEPLNHVGVIREQTEGKMTKEVLRWLDEHCDHNGRLRDLYVPENAVGKE